MSGGETDQVFAGSIPEIYDTHLVPLLFLPYAARIETVTARSRAASARVPAVAYCQGSPLRTEIEARDRLRLAEATGVAERAIVERFGPEAVDGRIQAHVVTAARRG